MLDGSPNEKPLDKRFLLISKERKQQQQAYLLELQGEEGKGN
jgi:hypothetical protein